MQNSFVEIIDTNFIYILGINVLFLKVSLHLCVRMCICLYIWACLFSFCWEPEEGFRSTRARVIGCCQKPDGNLNLSLGTLQEQKALNC